MYQHFSLLYTRSVLHVSTFPRSSSGESQEYQFKFLNYLNMAHYFTILVLFLIANTPL
jgi:hypothetical protein